MHRGMATWKMTIYKPRRVGFTRNQPHDALILDFCFQDWEKMPCAA